MFQNAFPDVHLELHQVLSDGWVESRDSPPADLDVDFGASPADTSLVRLDPKGSIAVGRALRKQPLGVRVLFCWALGFFWIGAGLWGGSASLWWAVALGVGFLVVPFVAQPLANDD